MKLWMLAVVAYKAEGNFDNRQHKIMVQTESFYNERVCEEFKKKFTESEDMKKKYFSIDASCKLKSVYR